MTQQYLRQLSLIVANQVGQGLELGALRITFEVRRGDLQTPNTCDVKVWNLSTQTSNALRYRGASEFTQLSLKVSYQGQPLARIFNGSIKQVRQGRENQLNSYIAITAAEGDEAYNFAPAAFCLAKGYTAKNTAASLLAIMANASAGGPLGGSGGQQLIQGYSPTLNPNQSIRGRVYYGTCRDELRDLADSQDCTWSIQDNQLTFIPRTGYIPGAPILISPSTGLIGVPEQTQNGLELRVLLNPAIKIGQVIKLQSTDINQLRYGLDIQSVVTNLNLSEGAAKQNADNLYYVLRAEHTGDTRGNQWYSDLTCLAVDATVPTPQSVQQAAVGPVPIQRY